MKTKRLVALVLALTMVFCFMAMSASAATTEIQPRATCANCGGWDTVTGSKCTAVESTFVSGCSEYPNLGHDHVTFLIGIFTCVDLADIPTSTISTLTQFANKRSG